MISRKLQFTIDERIYNEFLRAKDALAINNDPLINRAAQFTGLIWLQRLKAAGMWSCRLPKLEKMIDELEPDEMRYMLEELKKRLTRYEH